MRFPIEEFLFYIETNEEYLNDLKAGKDLHFPAKEINHIMRTNREQETEIKPVENSYMVEYGYILLPLEHRIKREKRVSELWVEMLYEGIGLIEEIL